MLSGIKSVRQHASIERIVTMKRITVLLLVIGLGITLIGPASVHADNKSGIKTGSLTLTSIEGTRKNFLIKSSVEVEGVFTDSKGQKEYDIGEMGISLGVDLSVKSGETIEYAVISPSSDYRHGSFALQGKYFGQDASVALGLGAGVKVLVGGFDKSFTLQPIALKGVSGVGANLGVGYLYLQKDPNK